MATLVIWASTSVRNSRLMLTIRNVVIESTSLWRNSNCIHLMMRSANLKTRSRVSDARSSMWLRELRCDRTIRRRGECGIQKSLYRINTMLNLTNLFSWDCLRSKIAGALCPLPCKRANKAHLKKSHFCLFYHSNLNS